jgi:O-antigen/teichoic acid export membrane protein
MSGKDRHGPAPEAASVIAPFTRLGSGMGWASVILGDSLARWSRLSLEFAVSHGLAQAAGMISGLIYVRLMPVDQYALYAMGLTALTFLSTGSDLGLTSALSYFWRKGITDGSAFEPWVATVLWLRSIFLILASVICGAMLFKAAAAQKLSMMIVFACFGLVLATAWSQTRTSVALLRMRFQGRQRQSYYGEGAGSVTRLLAAGAMIVTGINTAVFGLAGGLLGAIAIWTAARAMAPTAWNNAQPGARAPWREVLTFIAPMFPTMVVFMVQDPLVLWLAFTFGGQTPVSETFAVGRIAAIYAITFSFILTVVMPRLASVGDEARLTRLTGLFLLALILLCAAVMAFAWLAPSVLLLLIGPKYAHLHTEVILSLASASLGLLTNFLAIVNRMRGWVRLEPVAAACQVAIIFVLATHWSFHEAESVLRLMVVLAGFSLLGVLMISIAGLSIPHIAKAR